MSHLISICIPAYKQPALLERCIQSIAKQSYKQVEIIISDDTQDDSVKIIVEKFANQLKISYRKNERSLGTPSNWNAALKAANGDFLLLLHHDDYFASELSLEKYLQPFNQKISTDFVFGRNPSIEQLSPGKPFSGSFFTRYYNYPELLLTGNLIGAPSNVLLRTSAVEPYCIKYKWIVDIEFYIRLFKKRKNFFYIDEKLVEIGIHEDQVTNSCINNDEVLLFENIFYATENNLKLKSVSVYDFYWRLIRNTNIRDVNQLIAFSISPTQIPSFIKKMIAFQRIIPQKLLRNGIISKPLMFINFLVNR